MIWQLISVAPCQRVSQRQTGCRKCQPDGAMVLSPTLADAFTRPALGVELDRLGDLVGRETTPSANAGVGEEFGDGRPMYLEGLGELVGPFALEVAIQ